MAGKTKDDLKAAAKKQREEIAELKAEAEARKAEHEAELAEMEALKAELEKGKAEAGKREIAKADAEPEPEPEARDEKYLKEPVVYMAVKGKGNPVKEHDLVLTHDHTQVVNGMMMRSSGKIAHFTPLYSTASKEEVEILNRKVARGAFMGLRIISLTAERKMIGEMPRGMEQIDEMRKLASDENINKLVKQRVKGKTNYMDLTRGEAHTILTELRTAAGKRGDAAVAKKTSERAHLRESQPPLVGVET